MGDYYYAGLGVDAEGSQIEEAAACYQSAANTRISAMAMWNLGWMHENGKGVAQVSLPMFLFQGEVLTMRWEQDYHLAKRYYDMALETSADAYLPATLSLISLHVRSLYHTLFGSTEEQQKLSLFSNPPGVEKPPVVQTPWGVGRAWREIQRRWGYDPGPEPGVEGVEDGRRGEEVNGGQRDVKASQRELEGNEEPREWRRHGENGRVGEEEEDEFFLEGEGDLTGTVAIVALCMLLACASFSFLG
jgi:SEL1 protein